MSSQNRAWTTCTLYVNHSLRCLSEAVTAESKNYSRKANLTYGSRLWPYWFKRYSWARISHCTNRYKRRRAHLSKSKYSRSSSSHSQTAQSPKKLRATWKTTQRLSLKSFYSLWISPLYRPNESGLGKSLTVCQNRAPSGPLSIPNRGKMNMKVLPNCANSVPIHSLTCSSSMPSPWPSRTTSIKHKTKHQSKPKRLTTRCSPCCGTSSCSSC